MLNPTPFCSKPTRLALRRMVGGQQAPSRSLTDTQVTDGWIPIRRPAADGKPAKSTHINEMPTAIQRPAAVIGIRSRISTDLGTCGSNRLPTRVIFPLYAHEDRAS
ncbi:hypothetical protein ACFV4J_53220, partial [Streptomyces mirabilis]